MTNKEKIRELARKHQGTMTDAQYIQMQYALEEIVEWKEEQMIEKSCCVLESILIGGVHPQGIQGFIKQFKQAMKQQKSGC